jgi:hydrogenase/urease accessory protein HupE
MGVPLSGVQYGIAASAILLGAWVLFEVRRPLAVAAALAGIFAIFHGHAHGTELPPGQSGLLPSMGFVIATDACMQSASLWARSTAGDGDNDCCVSPAPSWR